ncbi:hypothetical protein LIER_20000 [Lithospermum erythrorhizon]|uniref:Uncharacterized protein n=1 Tax=Lithospermum erythrorhizon TaxID=34254 RepID=A0AAV3QMJ3_LITER
MWIIGAVLEIPVVPKINPGDHKVFPVLVIGWMVLAAFLIVLYAIQLGVLLAAMNDSIPRMGGLINNWKDNSSSILSKF